MKLVIDIPEEDYILAKKEDFSAVYDGNHVAKAIKHGVPIDLEGLKSDMKALNCGFPYGLDYLLDCLDKRLGITIIEAEGSESE